MKAPILDAATTSDGATVFVLLKNRVLLRMVWTGQEWSASPNTFQPPGLKKPRKRFDDSPADEEDVSLRYQFRLSVSPDDKICRIREYFHPGELPNTEFEQFSIADNRPFEMHRESDGHKNEAFTHAGGAFETLGWSEDGRWETLLQSEEVRYSDGVQIDAEIAIYDNQTGRMMLGVKRFPDNQGGQVAVDLKGGRFLIANGLGTQLWGALNFPKDANPEDVQSGSHLFSSSGGRPSVGVSLLMDVTNGSFLPCNVLESGGIESPWDNTLQVQWQLLASGEASARIVEGMTAHQESTLKVRSTGFLGAGEDLNEADTEVIAPEGGAKIVAAIALRVRQVEVRDESGVRFAQLDQLFPLARSFIHEIGFVDRRGEVFWVTIGDEKYPGAQLYFFDRRSGRRLSSAFSFVPNMPDLDGELSAIDATAIARFAENIAGCRVARHGGLERIRNGFDLSSVPEKWKVLFSCFR
jgi:hypothetical protein